MKRIRLFTIIVFVLTTLFASTTDLTRLSAQSTTFTVVSERVLDVPRSGQASLSPDGSRVVWNSGKNLCFVVTDTEEKTCHEMPFAPDEAYSLRWSPDGTMITFTEQFFRMLIDPDIHVMDAATGEITNLTDDGQSKFNIGDSSKNGLIDVAPHWSADGKSVLFLRYDGETDYQTASIYSIAIDGSDKGEATKMIDLDLPEESKFVTYEFALSPDATRLAYNVDNPKKRETINGAWLTADGSDPKQILQTPAVTALSFSADGRYLMAYDPLQVMQYATRFDKIDSSSHVVDLESGKEITIDPEQKAHFAAWSPDGSKLAYIVRDMEFDPEKTTSGLYITDEPGKPGTLVYRGLVITPAGLQRPLTWGANNKLLVFVTNATPYVLITLKES